MNGFYGSAFGNILGTLYFLLFQCVGVLYIKRIFPEKGLLFHLLTGSVSGSVLLQWIPALFAFHDSSYYGSAFRSHLSGPAICLLPSCHGSIFDCSRQRLPAAVAQKLCLSSAGRRYLCSVLYFVIHPHHPAEGRRASCGAVYLWGSADAPGNHYKYCQSTDLPSLLLHLSLG